MFGKSGFRDENGKLDLPMIERRIEDFFSIVQKKGLTASYHVTDLPYSEATKLAEDYANKDMCEIKIINELSVNHGLREDSYSVEITKRNSVKHF